MFEVVVKVEAPELSHAIRELASVLAMRISADAAQVHVKAETSAGVDSGALPALGVQAPQQFTPAAPVAAPPVAPIAAPPVAPPALAPSAVPTAAAPTYSMEQLAVAATPLMEAGRQPELMQLLNSFGVQALTMLQKEQYGAFATALRQMGARI
ncbi:hypothetical protein [Alicyclobacillus sp. ALC3]|uniref:hypothetical protein n=1 Tax=Alicyclobacillus sp. ALC3 TaxID=2796143 RepID=UPI002378D223|nr:hypothetical protein [Alicyclobacillus sp. ALC3]WDL96903.1 hypothetical protein JC200_21930 [Alicyclobacillus sp. ALC3]